MNPLSQNHPVQESSLSYAINRSFTFWTSLKKSDTSYRDRCKNDNLKIIINVLLNNTFFFASNTYLLSDDDNVLIM